jgi:hypothetical protein
VSIHFFSPGICELAFTDYIIMLEENPIEARTHLEDLLLNAEALECYLRVLKCLADDSKPTPRCKLDRVTLLEILRDGLRNISLETLVALALDGEALSELQCRVLEIDDENSFWCKKQETDGFWDTTSADDLAEAENGAIRESDASRERSPQDFMYWGNLRPIAGALEERSINMVPEMACSIGAGGILGTWTISVSEGISDSTDIAAPLRSSWNDDFDFDSVDDVVRLDEHLRRRLVQLAPDSVSAHDVEEIVLAVISHLWSLSRRPGSKGVSLREVNGALQDMCAGIQCKKRAPPTEGIPVSFQPDGKDGRCRANINSHAPDISALEKSVLVRRYVQYKAVHQVSRELGLNIHMVKEICERARRAAMDSIEARSAQNDVTVRSTLIPQVTKKPSGSSLGTAKRRTLERVQECLFWVVLGATMTALSAVAGRMEMIGGVMAVGATYALLSLLQPSARASENPAVRDSSGICSGLQM